MLAITSGSCRGNGLVSVTVFVLVTRVTVLGYWDASLELLGVDSESRELRDKADTDAAFLVAPS